METKRSGGSPRELSGRCNRRTALRWLGASALALMGMRQVAERAGAEPEPAGNDPAGRQMPVGQVDVSHDTQRVAGLGLAAAAVLVAGKLIRDKERDPEL